MKFTIVTDTFPPDINGVARTLQQLAGGLVNCGHEVTVVHPGILEQSEGLDRMNEQRVWGIGVPMYSSLRMGIPRKVRFLREWSSDRPDAVYVATEGLLGFSALRAARELEIPVVTGYHTHFPSYLQHYVPSIRELASGYLRFLHNQSDCTVTPSKDVALELHGAGYHNVAVLGRGVDTELFTPDKRDALLRQRWSARPESVVMLCVGRVAVEKNLPAAFCAFRSLQRRYPDSKMICVGDGPVMADYRERYSEVVWTGARRGEELARHFASADLFLFPSLTETYGNVLPEALASGLVTVSFDYAASAELVSHGVNGFSVDRSEGNEGFERCVDHALSLRKQWKSISCEARSTTDNLSWNRIFRRFETIMCRIADDSELLHMCPIDPIYETTQTKV